MAPEHRYFPTKNFRADRQGRPKQSLNVTTTTARNALVATFELCGGVPAMVEWAKANPNLFYPMIKCLIPAEIADQHGISEPIRVLVYAPQSQAEPIDMPLHPTTGSGSIEEAEMVPNAGEA